MGNLLEVMKKNAVKLSKPSATIAIRVDLSSLQRKAYNAFLYIAKESLKKDGGKREFTVLLSDIKKVFRETTSRDNKYYKDHIKQLMSKVAEYNILKKDKYIEGVFVLVSRVEFDEDINTREVVCRFEIPEFVIRLMQDKNSPYASIDLVVIKGLKSKYAVVLYELVKDFEKVKIPIMTIQQLKNIFGIDEKQYLRIDNLKKRVLDPAVNELNRNENFGFFVKYELLKNGRKYTHIKFHVKPKPAQLKLQQQADSLIEQEVKENTDLKKLLSLIPEEQRTERLASVVLAGLESKGFDYTKAQVEYCVEALKRSDIANFSGYVKSAIEEDYAGVRKVEIDSHGDEIKEEKENEITVLNSKYIGFKYRDVNGISVIKKIEKEEDDIAVIFEKKGIEYKLIFETVENLKAWLKNQERFMFRD